jgi:hypothetical protein
LKNTIIDRKHEETIKYCQEIIDRSWEHLHEQEIVKKETIMIMNERKLEYVKILSEVKDPLLDLEKCSLHELISILQNLQVIHL